MRWEFNPVNGVGSPNPLALVCWFEISRSPDREMSGGGGEAAREQNVVVMRHGDRIDHLEPLWVAHAQRPWDPPLADEGRIRAWTTGKRLRDSGYPIHRVVVSPFLRCLQTAAEVVRALCCVVDDHQLLLSMETSGDAVLDPSRVKVPLFSLLVSDSSVKYCCGSPIVN